jgi:hypothetical protein
MTYTTLLLLLLVVLLLISLPTWPYSRAWGYGPTGVIGTVLAIVLLLYLFNAF